jgi:hypothetical protein
MLVLQKFSLSRIVEDIDAPYQPFPLTKISGVQTSVFVSDDERSWHRSESDKGMMLVLEGVIIVELGSQKSFANEGDFIKVPAKINHNFSSGMRSTVLLFHQVSELEQRNGQPPAPTMQVDSSIEKVNAAAEALQGTPFNWISLGEVGDCSAHATRLWGKSRPYTPQDQCLLMVYRGVLEYSSTAGNGDIVGNEALVIEPGTTIHLKSTNGATVLLATRSGAALPVAQSSGATESGAG